jgi:hypothetical protein
MIGLGEIAQLAGGLSGTFDVPCPPMRPLRAAEPAPPGFAGVACGARLCDLLLLPVQRKGVCP